MRDQTGILLFQKLMDPALVLLYFGRSHLRRQVLLSEMLLHQNAIFDVLLAQHSQILVITLVGCLGRQNLGRRLYHSCTAVGEAQHSLSSHKQEQLGIRKKMVGRIGLEPMTNWLKANCSTN